METNPLGFCPQTWRLARNVDGVVNLLWGLRGSFAMKVDEILIKTMHLLG